MISPPASCQKKPAKKLESHGHACACVSCAWCAHAHVPHADGYSGQVEHSHTAVGEARHVMMPEQGWQGLCHGRQPSTGLAAYRERCNMPLCHSMTRLLPRCIDQEPPLGKRTAACTKPLLDLLHALNGRSKRMPIQSALLPGGTERFNGWQYHRADLILHIPTRYPNAKNSKQLTPT